MTPLLLETIYTNGDNLLSEVEALLDNGEDPNAITKNNDSPLRAALKMRRFDVIKLLILRGADESQLGWTTIFHAIAYGTLSQLEEAIIACDDFEHKDSWDRTPLLFSILVGSTSKTAMLIDAGADITAEGYAPLTYAIQNDDVNMLNFLIEHGFDIEQRNDCMDGETPLITASEYSATKCLKWLINNGADIFAQNDWQEQAITFASNREIANALVTAGANINDIDREARAQLLGYQIDKKPNVSKEDFLKGLGRVFGKSNPERASNPFWLAMVKCGGSGCRARFKFDDVEISQPVWSFDRFGKSITLLPDGRIIEIAGEHEDF
ncbi:MAG: ankyrin repeat domain-containing protein [Candidatus Comchoanobacterales bacterium]